MATIPSSWPSAKLNQNNTIQQIEAALSELEVLVNVPTIHSETEPTESELKAVIESNFGIAASLPNYTKIAWWQPSLGGIRNIMSRVIDLAGGLASGAIYQMCPEMPTFAAVLDYQVLTVDTASFQTTGMSQDYEYLICITTTRSSQSTGSLHSQIRWQNASAADYNHQETLLSRTTLTAAEQDGQTSHPQLNCGTTTDIRTWSRNLIILRDYANVDGHEQNGLQYANVGDAAALTDRSGRNYWTPLQLNTAIDLINWEGGSGNYLAGSRFLVIGLGKTGI